MATKKPTAAQLAARAKFAAMARSGAFKRKAKRAASKAPPKPRKTRKAAAPRKTVRRAAPRAASSFKVQVQSGGSWRTVAQFPSQAAAVTAAKNIHKLAPSKRLRVTD